MSENRKRKGKSFYKGNSKWQKRGEELRPGLKGFIITCNDRERIAVAEAYRLLNEYADKKYGPETAPTENEYEEEQEEEDIEKMLKKEVSEIKNAKVNNTERRFQSVENKAKNVIFIRTNLPDPAELVLDIFSDLQLTAVKKTKFCLRLLPVVKTCYAKVDEIIKAAKPTIESFFHNSSTPCSFHIMWKTRCNNTIKRDDVLPQLVDLIYSKDCGHTTDYVTPEYVFNIDIIGNICCFGFLKNFGFYKKYNLDSIFVAAKRSEDKSKDELSKATLEISSTDKIPEIDPRCNQNSSTDPIEAISSEVMVNADTTPGVVNKCDEFISTGEEGGPEEVKTKKDEKKDNSADDIETSKNAVVKE